MEKPVLSLREFIAKNYSKNQTFFAGQTNQEICENLSKLFSELKNRQKSKQEKEVDKNSSVQVLN